MALGKSVTLKDPYGLHSVTAERPAWASAPGRGGGWVNLVFPEEYSCSSLWISEPSADCAVQTQPSPCIARSPHPCFYPLCTWVASMAMTSAETGMWPFLFWTITESRFWTQKLLHKCLLRSLKKMMSFSSFWGLYTLKSIYSWQICLNVYSNHCFYDISLKFHRY